MQMLPHLTTTRCGKGKKNLVFWNKVDNVEYKLHLTITMCFKVNFEKLSEMIYL